MTQESARGEGVVYENLVEKDILSLEKEFLYGFVCDTAKLGLYIWFTMPVTYLLVLYGHIGLAYCFILLKTLVVYWKEKELLDQLSAWKEGSSNNLQHWCDSKKEGATVLSKGRAALTGMLDKIEFIDPDLDAMNAANAFLPKAQEMVFQESWTSFPVLRDLRLFDMLNGSLAFSILWQLYQYRIAYREVLDEIKKWPGSQDTQPSKLRSRFLDRFHGLVDIAGMFAISHVLRSYQDAEGRDAEGKRQTDASGRLSVIPPHRARSFKTKVVPEAVSSAWFTVSLLALAYQSGNGQGVIVTALIGVTSSALTAFKGLISLPELLKFHWTHRHDTTDNLASLPRSELRAIQLGECMGLELTSSGRSKRKFRELVFYASFTVVLFVGIGIRFVGVWYCKDHIFQLYQMKCLVLSTDANGTSPNQTNPI